MKLRLPFALLMAVVASFSSLAAEIPSTYTQIDVWDSYELESYTTNEVTDYYAFNMYLDTYYSPAPLISGGNLYFTTAEGMSPVSLYFEDSQNGAFYRSKTLTFDTLNKLTFTNIKRDGEGIAVQLGGCGELHINNVTDNTEDTNDVIFDSISSDETAYRGAIGATGADAIIDISQNGSVAFNNNANGGIFIFDETPPSLIDSSVPCLPDCRTIINSPEERPDILYTGFISISNNADVSFTGNKASYTGENGAAIASNVQPVKILSNADVAFQNNEAVGNGGAIFLRSDLDINFDHNYENDITIDGNTSVLFSGNKAGGSGGAIYISATASDSYSGQILFFPGDIIITNNGPIEFTGNSSGSDGGAIYSDGKVSIQGNGDVRFSGNIAGTNGGAIYSEGDVSIHANGDVSFTDNSGCAIYSSGTVSIQDNGDVTFAANDLSSSDNSIHSSGNVTIQGNGNVVFSGNEIAEGAGYAINSSNGSVSICGNENVIISGNRGSGIAASGEISIRNNGIVDISDNGMLKAIASMGLFVTPTSGLCVQSDSVKRGSVIIEGNESVTFKDNTSYHNNSYFEAIDEPYLVSHSIFAGNLKLAAKTGGHITFDNTIVEVSSCSFNANYADAEGQLQKATGDIIFKGSSSIGVVTGESTLYGGSLKVVDGASLEGVSLSVVDNSNATILLQDSTLSYRGGISIGDTNTLTVQGKSAIEAGTLTFASGSTLDMTLTSDHLVTEALSLTGNLDVISMTINLNVAGSEEGRYKILSLSGSYDAEAWNPNNVILTGSGLAKNAYFYNLEWVDNILYFDSTVVPELWVWSNTAGDGVWNTTTRNWFYGLTYADGKDVCFSDAGAGVVKLSGELAPSSIEVNNTAGNDYTFTAADGGGKLTGSTGITKQGEGKLSIACANEHTGATVLREGSLIVQHSQALGATAAGQATLSTAEGTTLRVENSSHLVLAGSNSIAGNVEVAAESTLEMKGSGYAAASSTVDGTLAFTGAAASTSSAGTLAGSGKVKVTDSQVAFSSNSGFTGDLSVEGASASLSLESASYSTAGKVEVKGGSLSFSDSKDLAILDGGSLCLSTDEERAAALLARNVNIRTGAMLSVQDMLGMTPPDTMSTGENVGLGAEPFNTTIGADLEVTRLTLTYGSTLSVDSAHINLSGGSLTLAVPGTQTDKIYLDLVTTAGLTLESQLLLFSEVNSVAFIFNQTVANTGTGVYSYNAADYFTSEWVNEDTKLVYDSGQNVLYMQGLGTIPEPATATLSLLALTALAARRRRK